VEGPEASVELGGGEPVLAIEGAEKIGGGLSAFVGVAFETAGDEVAKRIAAGAELGNDVVQAADARLEATEAVEAEMAIAEVNGFAERRSGEEIERLDTGGAGGEAGSQVRKT
jgi:hypothetical protein